MPRRATHLVLAGFDSRVLHDFHPKAKRPTSRAGRSTKTGYSLMTLPYRSNPTNQKMCPWLLLRLERTISRLAAQQGYDGDPLADSVPPGRSLGDLARAHYLLQSIPASLRKVDRELAFRMCQCAVFGSTRPTDGLLAPKGQTSPSAGWKLARERSRNRLERAGR